MPKVIFEKLAFNIKDKKKPVESDKNTYLGLEHLDPGTFTVSRFNTEGAPKGEKLVMKKGDILFGKRRAYQRKVAIAPFDGIFSAHGMVLRPNTRYMDPAFFPFFIRSNQFLDTAISISVGSLSPTVNWKDLKDIEFFIPTLQEQGRLAKILWAIEKYVEDARATLSLCDDLIKSRFVEMFGLIEDTSKGFARRQWKDVVFIISGKDHKAVSGSGPYAVYGTGGRMDSAREYLCDEHTLIMGRKGTIDKPYLAPEKCWIVDTAFGIVPKAGLITPCYLFYYACQLDFSKLNKSTTLPSTTKDDLYKLWINLPPIIEQKQFESFVCEIDKLKFAYWINSRFRRNDMPSQRHRYL